MPKPTPTPPFLSVFLIFSCFHVGVFLVMANAQKSWCVGKPSANKDELIANLDYACSLVDCSAILQGSGCFYPNTYIHHASFAMNLYYQKMGRHTSDCDFKSSGIISISDPSYLSCMYESGGPPSDNRTSIACLSQTWCVAKPSTSDQMLQQNIDFACNHVDCTPIQDSGICFYPTTLLSHAAFAMNLYYHKTGRSNGSCDFRSTGIIVANNPSYAICEYD